jgi:hypothetical protein
MRLAACEVTSLALAYAWSSLGALFLRRLVCRCEKPSRPFTILACDLLKAWLGTVPWMGALLIYQFLWHDALLWTILLDLVLVALLPFPLALFCWNQIIQIQRRRTEAGAGPCTQGVWRALQASGRYNPRQRLGLDDVECLDFRTDDETVSGSDVIHVTAVPKLSWWGVQCSVWMLVTLLPSLIVLGVVIGLRMSLGASEPLHLLATELEGLLPLYCGERWEGWLVASGVHFTVLMVFLSLTDRFHRFHGRTCHPSLR